MLSKRVSMLIKGRVYLTHDPCLYDLSQFFSKSRSKFLSNYLTDILQIRLR